MGFELGDLTAVEPSTGGGGYSILPPGNYRLGINDVGDEQTTNDGEGSYAYIEYAVADGELEGSTFRIFYNRKNKNPQAVEIAQRELAALGVAVGVNGGNADLLLGKTFMAKVGIKPASVGKNGKQYGESNNIQKYYRPDEKVAATSLASEPARPALVVVASPAVAPGAKPWAARR